MKEMLNTAFYCDLTANANDVMQRNVHTVHPEMFIAEMAEKLISEKPRVYPVVEDGRLIGIINRSQVLQELYDASVRCHHLTNQKSAV